MKKILFLLYIISFALSAGNEIENYIVESIATHDLSSLQILKMFDPLFNLDASRLFFYRDANKSYHLSMIQYAKFHVNMAEGTNQEKEAASVLSFIKEWNRQGKEEILDRYKEWNYPLWLKMKLYKLYKKNKNAPSFIEFIKGHLDEIDNLQGSWFKFDAATRHPTPIAFKKYLNKVIEKIKSPQIKK